MRDSGFFRIGTWNIHGVRGVGAERLEGICETLNRHRLDVVLLQEVSLSLHASGLLARSLHDIGLVAQVYSGYADAAEKRYGNVIASRSPLTEMSWPVSMRWPQLICAATLNVASRSVTVVNAHIPNGSGNGWEKVYAFEGLLGGLQTLPQPIILGGDFNEPKSTPPRWLSFRADDDGGVDGEFRDLNGVVHARQRWQEAVAGVLDDTGRIRRTAWGGQHVQSNTHRSFEPTHIVRGRFERYFDHILITDGLHARDATYHHGVWEWPTPASDHSLVTATVALD